MGISPAGATPASFMSYGIAKRISKNGHLFGTGQIEGVVAPETAAHAAGTSALLPMIALGVPGSPTAAVLLGGLLIWGLQPGPLLFIEQKDFVWGLIASMYMGNIVGLLIVLTCVPLFAAILRIPFSVIAPVIMVFCAIGAYTVHNNTFDVVMMVVFGVVGYFMKKCNYPMAPMVSGDRVGRQSGRGVPPVVAGFARQSWRILLERARQHNYGPWLDRSVLAGDPVRLDAAAFGQTTAGGIRSARPRYSANRRRPS